MSVGFEAGPGAGGAEPRDAVARVVSSLRDPSAYEHPVEEVRVIQTHISYVLLAGDFAYKLKKPVDFGFLDFRSLEQRRHFCEREVELNSRLSAGLYLGVVPIVRDGSRLRVGGEGEAIEYAVKMRRLPADRMMDALADAGKLTADQVRQVAERVAAFHARSPGGPMIARYGAPEVLAHSWRENFEQSEPLLGTTHSSGQDRLLREYVDAAFVRLGPLLRERVRADRIREGHGDLRTSAVCFDDACPGGLCIFDCIEFNERFRCNDVASEIAFLAMDLSLHHRAELAKVFVDSYVEASGDREVLRLLPFYACYRAYVRGKVEGFRFDEPEVAPEDRVQALALARKAFALACEYAEQDRPPVLLMMSGLSAVGKTTLANAVAERGGFEVLSSDVLRKELAGNEAGPGLYTEDRKRKVYEELHRRAGDALARGRSVIVDATFGSRRQRERARELAAHAGAYLIAVECRASEDAVRRRMDERERHGSVSDARFDVYLKQRASFEPLDELDEWTRVVIDTELPVAASAGAAMEALQERLRPSGPHSG